MALPSQTPVALYAAGAKDFARHWKSALLVLVLYNAVERYSTYWMTVGKDTWLEFAAFSIQCAWGIFGFLFLILYSLGKIQYGLSVSTILTLTARHFRHLAGTMFVYLMIMGGAFLLIALVVGMPIYFLVIGKNDTLFFPVLSVINISTMTWTFPRLMKVFWAADCAMSPNTAPTTVAELRPFPWSSVAVMLMPWLIAAQAVSISLKHGLWGHVAYVLLAAGPQALVAFTMARVYLAQSSEPKSEISGPVAV
jgi:hypothetical protein